MTAFIHGEYVSLLISESLTPTLHVHHNTKVFLLIIKLLLWFKCPAAAAQTFTRQIFDFH